MKQASSLIIALKENDEKREMGSCVQYNEFFFFFSLPNCFRDLICHRTWARLFFGNKRLIPSLELLKCCFE